MSPELIIAIATLILAGVTVWMAWETRRTAKTATKTLELEQMPVLGVRDFNSILPPPANDSSRRFDQRSSFSTLAGWLWHIRLSLVTCRSPTTECLGHWHSGVESFPALRLPSFTLVSLIILRPRTFPLRAGFGWSMNTRMSRVVSSARLWRR